MHNKFYVTLIHKFIKLYAVNSPDNQIIMRTLDKNRANFVAFMLNHQDGICELLKNMIENNEGNNYNSATISQISEHYKMLNDHSKPF